MIIHRLNACAVLLLLSACGEAAAPAGPRIAIAPAAAYDALPTFTLEDLGSACGAAHPACVASEFRLAAVNSSGVVAFWGSDGKRDQLYRVIAGTVEPLGRIGSGPGEYRFAVPPGVSDSGDVLLADPSQQRLVRYTASGEVTTDRIAMPAGFVDLLFAGGQAFALATGIPQTKGDSLPISVFALEAGASEARRLYGIPVKQPAYAAGDFRPIAGLFAPRAEFHASRDGHLFVTEGAKFEVEEFSPDGTHLARFGFALEPRVITDAEVVAAREQRFRRMPMLRMMPPMDPAREVGATHHPAVTQLVVLASGATWVRGAPRPAQDSVEWVVFPEPARAAGRVVLGSEETVLGGYEDRLLLSRCAPGADGCELRWVRLAPAGR